MLTLGIDTATEVAAVGLARGEEMLGELTFAAKMAQSERLLPALDRLLELAGLQTQDLELIAVSSGPGSFTGLRIGLAAAKGLALALRIPLVGVPTALSYAARAAFWDGDIVVLIHDRRNLVYHAVLRGTEFLQEERVVAIETVLEELAGLDAAERQKLLLLGSGAARYRELLESRGLRVAPEALNRPSASTVALLGAARYAKEGVDEVFTLEPRYIQRPLAEVRWEEKEKEKRAR